jgi:hypothetical protein
MAKNVVSLGFPPQTGPFGDYYISDINPIIKLICHIVTINPDVTTIIRKFKDNPKLFYSHMRNKMYVKPVVPH